MASNRNSRHNRRTGSAPAAGNAAAYDCGDFIDHTINVWQPHTERKLNREDGREIIENMTGFLRILQEWDRAERVEEAAAKRAAARASRKSATADRPGTGQSKLPAPQLAKS
jgi:hypothetical protein